MLYKFKSDYEFITLSVFEIICAVIELMNGLLNYEMFFKTSRLSKHFVKYNLMFRRLQSLFEINDKSDVRSDSFEVCFYALKSNLVQKPKVLL